MMTNRAKERHLEVHGVRIGSNGVLRSGGFLEHPWKRPEGMMLDQTVIVSSVWDPNKDPNKPWLCCAASRGP